MFKNKCMPTLGLPVPFLFPSVNVDNQELISEVFTFWLPCLQRRMKLSNNVCPLVVRRQTVFACGPHLWLFWKVVQCGVAERAAGAHRNAAFPNYPHSHLVDTLFLSFWVLGCSVCILFYCILYAYCLCIWALFSPSKQIFFNPICENR